MSLSIEFRIEAPVDPKDLLGEITLRDEANTFSRAATYVDSWFEAMVTAVRSHQVDGGARVEVVEEPESISLTGPPTACVLEVAKVRFAAMDRCEFEITLRDAASRLLATIPSEATLTPVLQALRAFACG